MNTRKLRKVLLTLCSALLLVSLSVGMTIAYLTDSESVINTFSVGQVHIWLDEADVWEAADNGVTDEKLGTQKGTERVKGNSYKLLPGHTYTKDPTTYVRTDSVDSYVRMKVEITNIANVKSVFGEGFLPQDFVTGWDPAVWETTRTVDTTTVSGSAIYEFRYNGIVDVSALTATEETKGTDTVKYKALAPLFTAFKVDGTKVNEGNISLLENVQIKVTANAIQADGFADANAAWAAFDDQKAAANQ